jgi:hypothetical protein
VGSKEIRTVQVNVTDTEASTNITVDGLMKDSHYHYSVLASNQLKDSRPLTPVNIGEGAGYLHGCMHHKLIHVFVYSIPVTTDVQDVTICRANTNTYIISCVYLSGSHVSGCNYMLVSREGNITGSIERSNSKGETIVLADTAAGKALQLQAYPSDVMLDVPSAGQVIFRTIMSVEPCPTTGLGT